MPAHQVGPPSQISTSLNLILDNDSIHGDSQSEASIKSRDSNSQNDNISEKSQDFVFENGKGYSTEKGGKSHEKKGTRKEKLSLAEDLQTEIGSLIDGTFGHFPPMHGVQYRSTYKKIHYKQTKKSGF